MNSNFYNNNLLIFVAELNPGLIMLIIWGIISWLIKKQKKSIIKQDRPQKGTIRRTGISELFQKLEDFDLFEAKIKESELEEDELLDYEIIEEKTPAIESDSFKLESEPLTDIVSSIVPLAGKNPTLKIKFNKHSVRQGIIMREILDKPLSLRPPKTGAEF